MLKTDEKLSRRAVLRRAALATGVVAASPATGSGAGLAQAPAPAGR